MNEVLRFGVGHTSMLTTSEIAQVQLGDLNFISDYLSLYVLLDDCQGVVGHRGQDFNTSAHVPCIDLNVTDIPLWLWIIIIW
jgi:hypothetical protein